MFQPKPIPKLPVLVKPIIPVWVLVAAMIAQYAIITIGNPSEPECEVKIEKIHYSTSVKRNLGRDSIKLNVLTKCDTNQAFSKLQAHIYFIQDNNVVEFYKSAITRREANDKNPKEADFLDFWQDCEKGLIRSYLGSVKGEVQLTNGKKVPVNGNTKKFLPVLCDFKAK